MLRPTSRNDGGGGPAGAGAVDRVGPGTGTGIVAEGIPSDASAVLGSTATATSDWSAAALSAPRVQSVAAMEVRVAVVAPHWTANASSVPRSQSEEAGVGSYSRGDDGAFLTNLPGGGEREGEGTLLGMSAATKKKDARSVKGADAFVVEHGESAGTGEGDEDDRPLRDALVRLRLLETGDSDDEVGGGSGGRSGSEDGAASDGGEGGYDDGEQLTDELLDRQIADLRRRIAEDDAMSLASSTPTPAASRRGSPGAGCHV